MLQSIRKVAEELAVEFVFSLPELVSVMLFVGTLLLFAAIVSGGIAAY